MCGGVNFLLVQHEIFSYPQVPERRRIMKNALIILAGIE